MYHIPTFFCKKKSQPSYFRSLTLYFLVPLPFLLCWNIIYSPHPSPLIKEHCMHIYQPKSGVHHYCIEMGLSIIPRDDGESRLRLSEYRRKLAFCMSSVSRLEHRSNFVLCLPPRPTSLLLHHHSPTHP